MFSLNVKLVCDNSMTANNDFLLDRESSQLPTHLLPRHYDCPHHDLRCRCKSLRVWECLANSICCKWRPIQAFTSLKE